MRTKLGYRDKLVFLLSEGFPDHLQEMPRCTTLLAGYVFHVPGMYNDPWRYRFELPHFFLSYY